MLEIQSCSDEYKRDVTNLTQSQNKISHSGRNEALKTRSNFFASPSALQRGAGSNFNYPDFRGEKDLIFGLSKSIPTSSFIQFSEL